MWGKGAGFHVHPNLQRQTHATHADQRVVDIFRSKQRLDTRRE